MLVKTWVVEDFCGNSGTMDGRIRVKWPDKDFDLRIHSLLLFYRVADYRESPHSLAIESLHASAGDHFWTLVWRTHTMFFAKLCARHS